MISKYLNLSNIKTDFISATDQIDYNQRLAEHWYLDTHDYDPFSFATDVFDCEEILTIKNLTRVIDSHKALVHGDDASGVLDSKVRRSNLTWLHINKGTDWIYRRITDLVNDVNKNHYKFDLLKIETLQLTHYSAEDNGCYKTHIDPLVWAKPSNRKLSFVAQLSDPEDYEGGDLRLFVGGEPYIVPKKLGLFVFFPSNTLHEVTPVTKGNRYTLVGWVHGPAFK